MIDYESPIRTSDHRGYTINVYSFGSSGQFYGEFGRDEIADAAAQGLYDTPDEALEACIELIDHPNERDEE
jgi:hypothetical protein